MPSTCLQKEKNAIELDETLDSGCEQSAQNEKAAELMLKPCVRCLQLFELTLLTCIALKPQPRKSKPGESMNVDAMGSVPTLPMCRDAPLSEGVALG
eukprot:CAMPEP_0183381946 /NCGR_PEP_ID=MMETSP0164_2-20130417/126696_1 /TAXON_ID=221442 /ORGANISM="Coccolithus pelagicus ssp braarudi, Strain PLY182g" /LENGTH=96 /DNA_ID=CAMNT_0025559557 /DNA_START=222 /DNA_END=513 /DNA_ORIENTATION=+